MGNFTIGLLGELTSFFTGTANGAFNSVVGLVKSAFSAVMQYNQEGVALARQMGMNAKEAQAYTSVLINRAKTLGKEYGIAADQVFELQKNISEATGRALMLNNVEAERMVQINKLVGSNVVNEFTSEIMTHMGGQLNTVQGAVSKAYATGAKSGLDAAKFSEKVAKNLSLANKLSFRDGVNGIIKMTALSEKLGFNLQSVEQAASNFMDIDKAIENSAKLQMLGGAAGAFGGNPLEMAFEANYDPEAFTERMTKTLGGLATFDKKTGMASVNGMNRDFVKSIAEGMGISMDEAMSIAKKQAEVKYKETAFGSTLGKYTQEQQDFIINKSYVDATTGHLMMNDVSGKAHDLSKEQLSPKLLEELSKFDNMTELDIMRSQAKSLISVEEFANGYQTSVSAALADGVQPYLHDIKNIIELIGDNILENIVPRINKITERLGNFFETKFDTFADGVTKTFTVIGKTLQFISNNLWWFIGAWAALKLGSWFMKLPYGGNTVGGKLMQKAFSKGGSGAAKAATTATKGGGAVANTVSKTATASTKVVKATQAVKDANNVAKNAANAAKNAAKTAEKTAKTAKEATKAAKEAEKVAEAAKKAKDAARGTKEFAKATQAYKDAVKAAKEAAKTAEKATQTAKEASSIAKETAKAAKNAKNVVDNARKTATLVRKAEKAKNIARGAKTTQSIVKGGANAAKAVSKVSKLAKLGGGATVGLSALFAGLSMNSYKDTKKDLDNALAMGQISQTDYNAQMAEAKNDKNAGIGGGIGSIVGAGIGSAIAPGVGTAIGAVVGDIVGDVIGKYTEDATNYVKEQWNGPIREFAKGTFGEAGASLVDGIGDITNGLWEGEGKLLNSVASSIGNVVGGLWDAIKTFAVGTWDGIGQMLEGDVLGGFATIGKSYWDGVKTYAIHIWDAIKDIAIGELEYLLTVAVGTWDGIKKISTGVWDGISGVAQGAWDNIRQFGERVWFGISNTAIGIWKGIVDKFSAPFNAITEGARGLWNNIYNFAKPIFPIFEQIGHVASNMWEGFRKLGEEGINWITKTAAEAMVNVFGGVIGIINDIKGVANGIWDDVSNFVSGAVGEVINVASSVWNSVYGVASGVFSRVADVASSVWNNISNFASNVFERISAPIINMWNNVYGTVSNIVSRVGNIASSVWNSVYGVASGVFSRVADVASSVWNNISNVASNVWNNISNVASNVWNNVSDSVGNFFGNIRNTVSSVFDQIGGFARNSWNSITDWFRSMWGGVIDWFRNRWNGVIDFFRNAWGNIVSFSENFAKNPIEAVKSLFGGAKGHAEGGIVGGNSYKGDNVLVRANSGEMILNQRQQAKLFDFINASNNWTSIAAQTIENRNDVKAKPVGGKEYIYIPTNNASFNGASEVTVKDINVNVSGTIKLDGGSFMKNIDVSQLLNDSSFVSSLKELIKSSINNDMNGGRFMNDNATLRGSIGTTTYWGR